MSHKDPKEHREYSLNYYHTHPKYHKMVTDNKRLEYWRKKYMFTFACTFEECKHFTESELREQIKEGICRI